MPRGCGCRPSVAALVVLVVAGGCAPRARTNGAALTPTMVAALDRANRDFAYAGGPVHPRLVQEFEGWLSDGGAITLAVDVRAAHGTDEYSEPVRASAGWVECRYEADGRPQSYAYRRLGTMSDGTHVLETAWNGGGSGTFTQLVFVRFTVEPLSHNQRDDADSYRLVMKCVRDFPLGDRDDGVIEVSADRVRIGPSRHRDREVVLTAS